MKYIFLTGSIVFGVTGISQAMDVFQAGGINAMVYSPIVIKFQHISFSFPAVPGFLKILFVSIGFLGLYLIRQRLKDLGFNKIQDYIPS